MEVRWCFLLCDSGAGYDRVRTFYPSNDWRESLLYGIRDGEYLSLLKFSLTSYIGCSSAGGDSPRSGYVPEYR